MKPGAKFAGIDVNRLYNGCVILTEDYRLYWLYPLGNYSWQSIFSLASGHKWGLIVCVSLSGKTGGEKPRLINV